MTSVNKPIIPMRVYVTPEQFDAANAASLRVAAGGPIDGLVALLVSAAMANGGRYSAEHHRNGGVVELIVLV